MNRRSFLQGAVVTRASMLAAAPRPNILWIIAEDFSPDLGCYGNRLVHTPHADWLASEGVRFENAFVTAPVCSASRSAIATGMYQTSIGAHQHRSHRSDGYRLPAPVRVFTEYFHEAGFHTSNVTTVTPDLRGSGKTDFNFQAGNVFAGTDWNQRKTGQPFYAQINFPETHRAFRPFPARPVSRSGAVPPPYYPDHPAAREEWALYLETAQNLDVKIGKVLDRLRAEGLMEETIVIFFGDHGRPMPRCKQFLYDGGIRIPFIVRAPEKFRPAGFRPGSVRRDLVSAIDITATSLQLAGIEPPPHMQGRPLFGEKARPREFVFAARDRCDETPDRIRSVRDARFKYIRNFHPERAWAQRNNYKDTAYPMLRLTRDLHRAGKLTPAQARFLDARRPAEELYDLRSDPHELRNLADSPEHRKTLARMRAALKEWIATTGDQGETPERQVPVEETRYRTQVNGWCTRTFAEASKEGGVLKVVCGGQTNSILRSCVAEGGGLTLKFRARSTAIRPRTLFWGTMDKMVFQPGPENRVELDFRADGEWRSYSVPFRVSGFLGVVGLDLGPGEGVIEFDSIELSRDKPGGSETIETWDFEA
jgi:N-sulfoglucosamine sulfohydrolase